MSQFIALIIGMIFGFGLAYAFHLKVQSAIDTIKNDFTNIHVRISANEVKAEQAIATAEKAKAQIQDSVSKSATIIAESATVAK
jgi:hypothetical protein